MTILSKTKIKEIQQEVFENQALTEKDFLIKDLCDTLLALSMENIINEHKIPISKIKESKQSETEGPKDTRNKTDWSIMPWDTLEEVCKIFEYGKEKYGAPFTYRKGIKFSKLYAATLRHLFSWWKGKDNDKESGYKHLAHICANAMMLMSMEDKKEFDDRDKKD